MWNRPKASKLVYVAVLVQSATSIAQQIEPARIASEGFSVRVDVVVTDRDNRIVTDLSAADFRLYEDGVPQTLDSVAFQERHLEVSVGRESDPVTEADTEAPREPPFLGPVSQNPCHIYLLDLSSTDVSGRRMLGEGLGRFFEENLGPQDCAAIFSLDPGFTFRQGFTNNKRELRDSVRDLNTVGFNLAAADANLLSALTSAGFIKGAAESSSEYQTARVFDSLELLVPGAFGRSPDDFLQRVIEHYLKSRAWVHRRQTHELLQAIQAIARGVAPLPGRKTLVLVSRGFVVGAESERELHQTVEVANNAGLAVYGLDPQGLEVYGTTSSLAQFGQISSLNADFRGIDAIGGESFFDRAKVSGSDVRDSALRYLTAATGGFAVRNTNDLRSGFRRIHQESGGYYLLAYRPRNQQYDGGIRSLRVEVKRPGVRVFHRDSYRAVPPGLEVLAPQQYQRLRAARRGELDLTLPARMRVYRFPSFALEQGLVVNLAVETGGLVYTTAPAEKKEVETAHLLLSYLVTDSATGTVVLAWELPVNVHLTRQERETLAELTFSEEWSLAPGEYTLEVIVLDDLSKRAAYLQRDLQLRMPSTRILISDVVLGSSLEKASGQAGLLDAGEATVIPSADRVFGAESRLIFHFRVCSRAQEVSLRVFLARAGENSRLPVAELMVPAVGTDGGECLAVSRYVELDGLAPGAYALTVEAGESEKPVQQTAWFEVRPRQDRSPNP
ncbi:MAG: hypothetical protein Kow001_00440 [Acidobacteriota bacterium]